MSPQPDWQTLQAEVRELARRVACLERRLEASPAPAEIPAEVLAEPAASGSTPLVETAGLVPLLGQSLLGLAGAYLLRALTESGSLPHQAGVACGILYSMVWLVWAARTPSARRVEAALRSLTSVLILCPLLWEATVRFQAVPNGMAGFLLLLFSVSGLVVSWRKDLLIVATIATLAGLGTSAGLLMATHDVTPFAAVILSIAAAVEAAACLDHWLGERWIAAVVADLTVLLATWLVTNERGLPPNYAPISIAALLASLSALVSIYLASTIVRTLWRGRRFTGFEIAQCAAAVAIAVNGAVRLSERDPRLGPAIGGFIMVCAAACYLVSFLLLDRRGPHDRNFFSYSTFGLLLSLAGTGILLSGVALPAVWAVAAVAAMWAGGFHNRLTLQIHGGVYLVLALTGAGAFRQATSALLTVAGEHQPVEAATGAGALAALVCYAISVRRAGGRSDARSFQALRLAVAASLVWLAAGLAAMAATGAYHEIFGGNASRAYCATLRTSVLAGGALLLAWAGPRWNRIELTRLAWPLAFFGAWRLVVADWQQEGKTAFLLSLLAYGATLIMLPRLWRRMPRGD
jgi:hypothetical protein